MKVIRKLSRLGRYYWYCNYFGEQPMKTSVVYLNLYYPCHDWTNLIHELNIQVNYRGSCSPFSVHVVT